jgi:hypothetical protein
MAAFLGDAAQAQPSALEKLTNEDRDALGRARAFVVPALIDRTIDFPRTLEANRELLRVLRELVPIEFDWTISRPVFASLHKEAQLNVVLDAPVDEATGQPMCLIIRGPVTHVEQVDVTTEDGRQRLARVQRSFSATTDFRATLRSFAMTTRIERAIWANVQMPFQA